MEDKRILWALKDLKGLWSITESIEPGRVLVAFAHLAGA